MFQLRNTPTTSPPLPPRNKVARKLKRLGTTFFYTAIKQNRMTEERKAKTRIELVLENAKLREELANLKDEKKHIIIPIYWGIDEETGKKIYDTDEMRDEFENAMGDFETDEYAECCDCGKELEEDEHTQLDEGGRCVCDDCFGGK